MNGIDTLRLDWILPFFPPPADAVIWTKMLLLGLKVHPYGMYVYPSASRSRIKNDLKAAYKDCVAHRVEIDAPNDFTVLKEEYGVRPAAAKVFNISGGELKGRKIQWSSLDPGIVAVNSTGDVFGVDIGVGRIVAANHQPRDTVWVTVLGSCAGTGGICHSWDPDHPCACV